MSKSDLLKDSMKGGLDGLLSPTKKSTGGKQPVAAPTEKETAVHCNFIINKYYLVPEFYRNGWLALTLVMVEDEDEYIVLSVNLEEMDALGLPDRTFIDVNHYPEAMEFLVKNGLATDSEYKRRSGFVEYPMAMLNLPLLYQHNPQIFQKANIEPFGEECF